MKTVLSNNPSFSPGAAGAGTLTFTPQNFPGFDFKRLLAVVNQSAGKIIYTIGVAGNGGTWNSGNSVLTLQTATTGQTGADILCCIYDDPNATVTIANTATSGLPNTFHVASSGATIASTPIKSSPGTIYGITIAPKRADNGIGCFSAYLKIYNTANPTVGVTAPLLTYCLIDGSGNTPLPPKIPAAGVFFSTAISYAITANPSDNDTVVPQDGHVIDIHYI